MIKPKRTLYIGAHPDDITIGAGITISRNPNNSHVLIMSNGATIDEHFPAKHGVFDFNRYEKFAATRIAEDREAMRRLGLPLQNYMIFKSLQTERAYLYIPLFVETIRRLAQKNGIERLVTHQFAEAHPDHEIASFCAHHVAGELGLEVFEYPMYIIDENNNEIAQRYSAKGHQEKFCIVYSDGEKRFKDELLRIYQSQIYIVDMFTEKKDQFGKITRNFRNTPLPETTYWYRNDPSHPAPEVIRQTINNFLKSA